MLGIVTLKFKKNKKHNPQQRVWGKCQLHKVCTDSLGEHHSFILEASTLGKMRIMASNIANNLNATVTRIELEGDTIPEIREILTIENKKEGSSNEVGIQEALDSST